jgi:hypothetical protein
MQCSTLSSICKLNRLYAEQSIVLRQQSTQQITERVNKTETWTAPSHNRYAYTNSEQSTREKSGLVQTSVRRMPLQDNCFSDVADTRGSAPVHQLRARSGCLPIWQRSDGMGEGGGEYSKGWKTGKEQDDCCPPRTIIATAERAQTQSARALSQCRVFLHATGEFSVFLLSGAEK